MAGHQLSRDPPRAAAGLLPALASVSGERVPEWGENRTPLGGGKPAPDQCPPPLLFPGADKPRGGKQRLCLKRGAYPFFSSEKFTQVVFTGGRRGRGDAGRAHLVPGEGRGKTTGKVQGENWKASVATKN